MDRRKLGREFYELGLRLGGLGTVAIGSGGGELAKALARTAGCGVALAGGEAKFHDGGCAACGAWLAEYYGFPASLFVRQEGEQVELFLMDGQGKRLTPVETDGTVNPCTGGWDLLVGADCAWAAHRAGKYQGELGTVCARGPAALTLALERMGYEVADRPVPGAAVFQADREGFSLQVEEGDGTFALQGEDALAGLADYVRRPQAVPAFRPNDGAGQETPL
ncbi:MAG: hypothetical protein HDT33_04740 [Clostridiales bacterium]|nr:hypothetical protein [Clostridiales bacterium]